MHTWMTAQPGGQANRQIKPPDWGQLNLTQATTSVAEVPDQGEESTARPGYPCKLPRRLQGRSTQVPVAIAFF